MQSPFLRAGLPFGCLGAALLGIAMALVIVIGSVMGDCEPGPGCHDHDGFLIARGLLLAVPIIFLIGVIIAALAAAAHAALRDRVNRGPLHALVSILTVVLACLSFNGAFALFFWLSNAAGQ